MEGQREEFILRVLSKEKSKSALCREYGISRPTGDKWIGRYQRGESMGDRSRAPFNTSIKQI
jgi:transposase-like protein